jgi:Rrf2 family nitric oxide-sensitive transcriptional repressor
MRITKRTHLAMRILMFCAVNQDRTVTKADIAAGCNSSENHIGQVVNQLARIGYLKTLRGRHGGLRLDKPSGEMTVGNIFRAFEAEVPLTECLSGPANTCPLAAVCWLRDGLCDAQEAFYRHLDGITLDQLVSPNAGLKETLSLAS